MYKDPRVQIEEISVSLRRNKKNEILSKRRAKINEAALAERELKMRMSANPNPIPDLLFEDLSPV